MTSTNFNEIPPNLEVPLTYVEFDTSQASSSSAAVPYKVLLIGQSVGGQITVPGVTRILNDDQVIKNFGAKSDIFAMYKSFRSLNLTTEIHAGAMKFDNAATRASCEINVDFLGGATNLKSTGTVVMYVFGKRISVTLTKDSTEAQILTAIKTKIDEVSTQSLIGTTSIANGVLTVESSIVGSYTSELTASLGFGDEASPLLSEIQVGFAVTKGSGDPNVSEFMDSLPSTQYKVVVNPWASKSCITTISDYLAKRFGALYAQGGVSFVSSNGTYSTVQTEFESLNSKFSSIISADGFRVPGFIVTARVAGAICQSLQENPAVPVSTIELGGDLYPPAQQIEFENRNALLNAGISTLKFDDSFQVQIERLVTTYKKSPQGSPDSRFHDINPIYIWLTIRENLITSLNEKFKRHILVDDGATNKIRPGQPVVTPKSAKGEIVSLLRKFEEVGWIENVDTVKDNLIVRRSQSNRQRLESFMDVDPANQLQILGIKIGTLG